MPKKYRETRVLGCLQSINQRLLNFLAVKKTLNIQTSTPSFFLAIRFRSIDSDIPNTSAVERIDFPLLIRFKAVCTSDSRHLLETF